MIRDTTIDGRSGRKTRDSELGSHDKEIGSYRGSFYQHLPLEHQLAPSPLPLHTLIVA